MKAKTRFWRMLVIVASDSRRAFTIRKISLEQADAGAFDGDIRARTHGNSDIGRSERRGVVDTRHRYHAAFRLETVQHRALLVRQHVRLDLVNAELSRDGIGRGPVVAGQRLGRRPLDRIGNGEYAVDAI
jgi:hypothetical protein